MDVFFLKLRMASSALNSINIEPMTNGAPGNWKNEFGLVKK